MKSSHLRSLAALLAGVGLAACGGTAEFEVKGTLLGLTNQGLVLSQAGSTISPAANATAFAFPAKIDYGNTFDVLITAQPAHQTCSIIRGSRGTAGQTASIEVSIGCVQNSYTLGGTISGLTGAGLELANGSAPGTVIALPNATKFVFPAQVFDGASYSVAVLKQPAGLTCSVSNGTAIMKDAAVANIAVGCAPTPP